MSIKTLLIRTVLQQNKLKNYAPLIVRYSSHGKNSKEEKTDDQNSSRNDKRLIPAILGSVILGAALSVIYYKSVQVDSRNGSQLQKKGKYSDIVGEKRPDLPTFRADEVMKHDNKSSFWVTYKHGVYDVTKFLPSHPGGEQILNAGGYSIEPFWNVYGIHKTEEVFKLLESYRIGNLHDEDVVDHSDDELWAKEPARDRRLVVKTPKPFNAETPAKLQVENFDTPNELFFVRQHMPVPELNAQTHKMTVIIKDRTTAVKEFSLKDLDKFPSVTMRATLMCAGNRRSDMHKVKEVKGLGWTTGAISTAVWRGVPLIDVLVYCGADKIDPEGKHVVFAGADVDATGHNFSTSIPLYMALNPNSKILLATHMNGSPLPPDHGCPLRVVVPGAPAVRSVKWLESITISEDEANSHFHKKDYRSFNPSTTADEADWENAPPLYSLPVTSAICEPLETAVAKNSKVQVKGYAYSGGGAKIVRVDVSTDQGASWRSAPLSAADGAPPGTHYAWTLWALDVPVAREQGELEIWVKATDSNFNTQPENFRDIWNFRGILSNAYHKVKVKVHHS